MKNYFKSLAESFEWEIQSAILSIRDDGLTSESIPADIYKTLTFMKIVEGSGEKTRLTDLGEEVSYYCVC